MAYVLNTTTKSIEVILAGAVTANQLPFTAHYADKTATAFTPGENDGTTNDAVAVTMIAAPAASTERLVAALSVHNADTATATVTVQLNNNATTRIMVKAALAANYTLSYGVDVGWQVLNASGAVAQTLSADEYLLRDGSSIGATGAAQDFGSNGIEADVIAESTAATGVTIDGVLIKDDQVDARGLTDLGELLFTPDDLLLIDFQRWLKNTGDAHSKLIGSRLEQIVRQGALHYVPGRFPGSRALAVEPAGTNHIVNPVFGVNVTDGWTNNGMATYERPTTQARFGTASMRLVSDALADYVYSDAVADADGGEDWTAVVWVYLVSGDFQVTIEENNAGWTDNASQAGGVIGQWTRVDLSVELSAGVTDGRVKLEPEATAASEFYIGYVGFHPTAYAPTAIYGDAGPGYAWTGTPHNSTSTRTATEVNLDSQVDLISGNDTLTIATWVKMPFDSDDANWPAGVWANYLISIWEDADNRVGLFYRPNGDTFNVEIETATVQVSVISTAQTFSAGDWKHLGLTVNYAGDATLSIDGQLDVTEDISALASITPTEGNLGSTNAGANQAGIAFDEFAVFDRVLTAAEIAGLYANQRPLIDEGALETRPTVPGVSAGYWPLICYESSYSADTNWDEAGFFDEWRNTFAGGWISGQIQFQAMLKNAGAHTSYAKLQYYHTDSAAWVDVPDSEVNVVGTTVNRVRSGNLAIPQQEYEYRVMLKTSSAGSMVTCFRAGLVASPGSSTLL